VLGALVPLALTLLLAALIVRTHRSDLSDGAVRIVALWAFAGGLALGGTAGFAVFHLLLEGVTVDQALYFVATTVTVGALFGIIAGRYDAHNRQKAALIEALQEATTELSEATTRRDVCDRAVEIAHRVLDIPLSGVWLYDEAEAALVPVAVAEPSRQRFETPPTYRRGESLSWTAFETGTLHTYDDVTREATVYNSETVIRSEIIVPLGEFGVMNFGSTTADSFESLDVTVARLLGTATTAALRRADREEQLRRRRRELRRQNERLDEFTSVVSHDLRNPLSVAIGRLELARETLGDPDGDLNAVEGALNQMESLINDLLALARQGQTVGETRPVSLADAAADAWGLVRADRATLDVTADRTVDADPERLRQLLTNLFQNAVTHGSADVTVSLGETPDGFYVADDGPGISPEERETVFDAGHTTDPDGSGFGLTIVRRVAEAHGWSITAGESETGGARFDIEFEP